MDAALQVPVAMSVEEFLAWSPQEGGRSQLVDGAPQAMAPANRTHGALQSEVGRLIGNHLAARGGGCSVVTTPGIVPRVRAADNVRIPDLAVTCSPYQAEEPVLSDPVLIVEILSPSNAAATWANVWTDTTIPSVREILVLSTVAIGAELLRRRADGAWPERPLAIADGALTLDSIAFSAPIAALYWTTRLAVAG